MQKRLRSPADFTAVFAIADDMAIGAMRALRESGRSIPEDCSVIAIDGISVSEYIHPMLTTLCQPMTAMERRASRSCSTSLRDAAFIAMSLCRPRCARVRPCGSSSTDFPAGTA